MIKETNKITITKSVMNFIDFMRLVLIVFLIVVIFMLSLDSFEIELNSPFFEELNNFLFSLSRVFYTPGFSEEGSSSPLIFLSIAFICLFFLFEFISSTIDDLLKMYQKNKDEAIAADNEQANRRIQKNYEEHLRNSVQFIMMINFDFEKAKITQAFEDIDLDKEIEAKNNELLNELRSTIITTVKCKYNVSSDTIILQIPSAEVLNRVAFYLRNLSKTQKFAKSGLNYYIAISAYFSENPVEIAIQEAKKLVNLKIKNKMLCYQIAIECLRFVPTNNFRAESIGDYYDVKESLFELVNKN